jgi:hypothetical protein
MSCQAPQRHLYCFNRAYSGTNRCTAVQLLLAHQDVNAPRSRIQKLTLPGLNQYPEAIEHAVKQMALRSPKYNYNRVVREEKEAHQDKTKQSYPANLSINPR